MSNNQMNEGQMNEDHSMLVLAVDTSAANASFALLRNNEILAVIRGDSSVPHSRTFFNHITDLLKTANVELNQIDVLAAATGPGSFTGLRVGLSAIKGLAHALGRSAIGINSIDAIALSAGFTGEMLVIIEAGRHEFYSGLRQISAERDVQAIGSDRVGSLGDLLKSAEPHISDNTAVIFNSQSSEMAIAEELMKPGYRQLKLKTALTTTAEQVAFQALKLSLASAKSDLHPHYIRPSDAEIKRKD